MPQLVDNRYQIIRPLGSGGMAEVYLAHDDVLDRDVALKILNNSYSSDDEFIERFRREAQNAAALTHPNIVSIYDRGQTEEDQETYYIAMEYLPGGSLKDRINSRGALSARTAAEVALQIAEALKAAHERDVVHRDIKPHNILVTETGDLKVTDFGIARAATSSTMTRTGSIMGTAHYISPEQAMGEPAGPQSDLYSLGVVLYEMLTGELPFDAETPIGIAMKHVNSPPTPPSQVDSSIPEGLDAITYRLMSKDPEDRYPDESELIDDLESVVQGYSPGQATTMALPVVAPPAGGYGGGEQTMTSNPGGGRRSRRALPLVIVLLLLALIALVGWAAYTMIPQSSPTAQVPELEGLTLQEARDRTGEDFGVSVSESRDSREPEDTVLEQSPGAGSEGEQGSEISVVVSGQRVVEVPDVVSASQNEAESQLAEDNFGVNVETEESSADEEGNVVSQSPSAGEDADFESEIDITVGSGPADVETPDLSGMTVSEAESELSDADLELGEQAETASDEVDEGDIVEQSPGSGSEVEPGSAVDITVSTGPEPVSVPSIYGYGTSQAESILADAGLDLGQVSEEETDEIEEGLIFSQSQAGGATVEPGTAIDVTVSAGPAPISVPNVIGDEVIDAQRELEDAGLGYTTQGIQSDESAGTVLSTDPAAGSEVDPDTQVDISYSLGAPEPAQSSAPEPQPELTPQPETDQGAGDNDDEEANSVSPPVSPPEPAPSPAPEPQPELTPQPSSGGGGDSGNEEANSIAPPEPAPSPAPAPEPAPQPRPNDGGGGNSGSSGVQAPDIEEPEAPDIEEPDIPDL